MRCVPLVYGFITREVEERRELTASGTMRRRVLRSGGSVLIFKRDNRAIGLSRTNKVRGIFKAFKAFREGTPRSKSGWKLVKYSNSMSEVPKSGESYFRHMAENRDSPDVEEKGASRNMEDEGDIRIIEKDGGFTDQGSKRNLKRVEEKSYSTDTEGRGDCKTAEETTDLAAQPTECGVMNLLSSEKKKLGFGKRLIKKRKHKGKWVYRPELEPDYNVQLEYFFEDEDDEDGDEDEDEDEGEVEYGDEDEEDEDSWFNGELVPFIRHYTCFDESRKRNYFVRFLRDRPCHQRFHIRLLQKALKCNKSQAKECYNGNFSIAFCAYLSEEEADAIAGLDEVLYVTPGFGWVES